MNCLQKIRYIITKVHAFSGNRWVDEILNMLLSRKTEMSPRKKFALMEQDTEENFDKTPSPRVISTHLPLRYLPKQLEEKKTKMVLMLRNPKDCAVSYYHVMVGMRVFNYSGKFEDFLKLYIEGKRKCLCWYRAAFVIRSHTVVKKSVK